MTVMIAVARQRGRRWRRSVLRGSRFEPFMTRMSAKSDQCCFLRQHDRDDALGDVWVGRIGGMHGQRGIEIIDLEKDRVSIGFERAKVMLFVRVVGMAKAVVYFDGADDTGYRFGT
jgi:hypothetical protein